MVVGLEEGWKIYRIGGRLGGGYSVGRRLGEDFGKAGRRFGEGFGERLQESFKSLLLIDICLVLIYCHFGFLFMCL